MRPDILPPVTMPQLRQKFLHLKLDLKRGAGIFSPRRSGTDLYQDYEIKVKAKKARLGTQNDPLQTNSPNGAVNK